MMASVQQGRTDKKRFRSCSVGINEDGLYKDLVDLASSKKKAKYRWDGKHYSKPTRSLGPDKAELDNSSPVLLALTNHAQNGFPRINGIRNVWQALDNEFEMMETKNCPTTGQPISQFNACQRAADIWKTMLRHCVDLKCADTRVPFAGLQEVLDALKPERLLNTNGIQQPLLFFLFFFVCMSKNEFHLLFL